MHSWQEARRFMERVMESETPMVVFGEKLENIGAISDNTSESLNETGKSISDGLMKGMEEADVEAGSENLFSRLIGKIKELFGIIEGLLNGLKNMWGSVTSWIEDKIEWIIDKFQSVKDKVSGFFSGGGGGESSQSSSARSFSMRSMSVPYSMYPAIEKLNNMPIPGYATGQVIPRTMKKHLAILGDNNRETEVVSPLSTIEQAVINAMGKIDAFSGNMGGTPVNLTLQVALDGQVIGQKMVAWGKIQQMATGVNPYELGTT